MQQGEGSGQPLHVGALNQSLLIFGLGFTGARIAKAVRALGFEVNATGAKGNLRFDDSGNVKIALAQASHILSTVPPVADGDPVLNAYGQTFTNSPAQWRGYLSSTGVYGNTSGAWVDECSPLKGRRASRNVADQDWQRLGAHIFRLPGIYGPGRSALDRVAEGKAHRIDLPGQVFSRVHVDDIVAAVIASFDAAADVYNIADELPCSQNRVIEEASALLGLSPPLLKTLEEASLSPAALAFYGENRRVANNKAKRLLGWSPRYPTYVEGLRALNAMHMPAKATALPATASKVQR